MNVAQAWLLIGVPGLIVVAALFTGRDRLRAWVGYGVLAVLALAMLTVDGGSVSAGIIGLVAVGLVAIGRGTAAIESAPEEQALRGRLTQTG